MPVQDANEEGGGMPNNAFHPLTKEKWYQSFNVGFEDYVL